MKTWLLALLVAFALAACSKVTQENFSKIQEGMSEQEVVSLLGAPTESNVGRDAVINVRFVNGKVALKSFDKPGEKTK